MQSIQDTISYREGMRAPGGVVASCRSVSSSLQINKSRFPVFFKTPCDMGMSLFSSPSVTSHLSSKGFCYLGKGAQESFWWIGEWHY
jgi:hypothetical protein